MTDEEVEAIVQPELHGAGVWEYVDENESQFLKTDHIFAHIILNDATYYERAVETMRSVLQRLHANGMKAEFHVRSRWNIISVSYRGPCYTPQGNPTIATCYAVELQSGKRAHTVEVGVGFLVSHQMQERKQDPVIVVRQFVEHLLAQTGLQYWEPLQQAGRELIDSSTLEWIESQNRQRSAMRERK